MTLFGPSHREHQLDDFLSGVWLQSLCVPFVQPNHVCNHVTVAALRIRVDSCPAWPGLATRGRTPSPRRPRVPYVSGFRVDDVRPTRLRPAPELLCPDGMIRQAGLRQFEFAGGVDVGQLIVRKRRGV
jgi:hypothetical protein